jgi:dipeptidyl aminopeptidase/acylaminoacyl peptidase
MTVRLGSWRSRVLALTAFVVLGWLGSSLAVAERLTRHLAVPAGPAPTVGFARSEDVALVARDGARVPAWAFDIDGARGTVVLLHPNGGSAASMLGTAQIWAELGFASIAVTLRGHGEAEGARNDFGWSARLDVVAAVEWAGSRRPEPVLVHGVSLGAAAACLAANEHGPEASARILGHVLTAWVFIGDVARIAPCRCAPELSGRVLILSGLRDTRAPAAETRRFVDALGERARLVERHLDHTGWLAAAPGGSLREDLADWLEELTAPPAGDEVQPR